MSILGKLFGKRARKHEKAVVREKQQREASAQFQAAKHELDAQLKKAASIRPGSKMEGGAA